MFNTEWLKELKAGDKVIINHGVYGGSKEVALVKRTTKTLIIVASPNGKYEYRFRKSDGFVPVVMFGIVNTL
jgi:preprotein translocase subunit YajC